MESPIQAFAHDYTKFVGITHDLHDIRDFIADMRLCFVLLTASGYAAGLIYVLIFCCKKCQGQRRKRLSNYNMYDPGDLEGVTVDKPKNVYSYRQSHTPNTDFDQYHRGQLGHQPNGGATLAAVAAAAKQRDDAAQPSRPAQL